MRYVQLRAFHHVATCGGFTRAAEVLCLTQPAISDQVRKLEEDYDVLLFDRSKRQVTLTGAGRRLLEATQRLFEAERQASEILSESQTVQSGQLRIIADSANHLVPLLTRFRHRFPAVRIEITSGNSEEVASALRSFDADIGVIGESPDAREFEAARLGTASLVAFVRRGHALARQKRVTLAELADQELVLRERGSRTRQAFLSALDGRGLSPRIVIQAEGREAVRELVAAGTGVGIVSAAELGEDSRIEAVRIADADISMDESLIAVRVRAKSRLITEFFALAREAMEQPA